MTQTSIENEICNACGTDVRPQASFCYNCGGAVAEKFSAEKLPEKKLAETRPEKVEVAADKVIKTVEPENRKKTGIQEEAKLKSAAALRRKSKSLQKKTIQVVWEEHENAPNVWFISAAIVLTVIAAVILFLAMYLR